MSCNSPAYQDDSDDCQNNASSPQTSSSEIVYSMQLDRFEVFKTQDQENGYFDCALEIDGKRIFVHKYFLATASETFKAMICDRWNKSKEEVIKIENPDYSYESFYEFLCFIYSGACNMTKENVFVLTDMAEFYGIPFLKESCDKFLQNIDITVENVEQMVEFSSKYSMPSYSRVLKRFVNANCSQMISYEYFVNRSKVFIEFLLVSITYKREKIFDAFYKWAQHQVTVKKLESGNGDINTEEWIKTEFKDFSSHFDFSSMRFKFIKKSIIDKRSLFSPPELYRILVRCQKLDEEHDECFKTLYELAKAAVTEKLQPLTEDNINDAIRKELTEVIPRIRFHKMSVQFLMEFVVENGFEFSFFSLYCDLAFSRSAEAYEEAFKAIYQLAEKKALMKQKFSNDEYFNLTDAIKKELIPVIPRINFYDMKKKFLMDFVVSNGILSEEELYRTFAVSISINQMRGSIHGIFNDVFGVKKCISPKEFTKPPQTSYKLSCSDKKFMIPSVPSTVMKMKGVEWYLCLDEDGFLMVKHHTLVKRSDYLIAEMKTESGEEFAFWSGNDVWIIINYKNN